MRVRLAELQRLYREKQRELSRLTPRKTVSSDTSGQYLHSTQENTSVAVVTLYFQDFLFYFKYLQLRILVQLK